MWKLPAPTFILLECMAVSAWACTKRNRGVLATRAATRFDHLRLSKEERFEQGPRAHQLPCRACALAEGVPQTLALGKMALRMLQSAMMLSELAVRPVALPQSPPSPAFPISFPPVARHRSPLANFRPGIKTSPVVRFQFWSTEP